MMPQSTLILFLTVQRLILIDSGVRGEGVVVVVLMAIKEIFVQKNLVLGSNLSEPEPDNPEPEPMVRF